MTHTASELNIDTQTSPKHHPEDKRYQVLKLVLIISTALSLLIGGAALFNIKAMPKYTSLNKVGKEILEAVIDMQLEEQNYLIYNEEDSLHKAEDKINKIKKVLYSYEKSTSNKNGEKLLNLTEWDEAINLYDRLLDQFNLYHDAIEKHIIELRTLEKSILAVIYSKMNPERGIIALQEVRIHEKGYFLYRHYPKQLQGHNFQDKRKEAVSNLLMWAQHDQRIDELMKKDDKLFKTILNCYKNQDNIFPLIKKESKKIRSLAGKLIEEGNTGLSLIYHRCAFLSMILVLMWLTVAIGIIFTRFR
jgi:hypothetical protein